MPHPERAVETILGSVDGLDLFKSLLNHISASKRV
jgi:phosphoribosylformylglycinamidine synthase